MARPTKYNNKILEKAKDYLINYEDYEDAVPSIAGLSIVLDITRETLNQWSKDEDKKEFSDTLSKIKQEQEKTLMSKGLKGEFNSTIAKLMLANHGYSDKQQLSGDPENPVAVSGINIVLKDAN